MSEGGDDGDWPYKIGYGRPPISGQFKKGRSGNPKGRPKKARPDIGEILTTFMEREISIKYNGKEKKLPYVEALIQSGLHQALRDPKLANIERILDLCHRYAPQNGQTKPDNEDEHVVRDRIEQMVRRLKENKPKDGPD